ncbi:LacI family DNA-binding transcriptional regulator [Paenibacillus piri]|uniref:LacI family transcriptional regulator n=1 Tax=Paenibacillus piri TaxID=2547395 RepID=A0A4R5KF85_9BACL|nr:LacI family DNA-binding transcriptional regulator [Paenibacillus piri]TDF93268.1 LacI family transcriptional regulator [Paenibacillus piri]
MTSNSIRQKEIAEKTGYSINTVSLALKGSPRISEETRLKIMECARQLNYIPNVVARSLVQKKTNTIGIILTELMNPILTETAQEIEQLLKQAGYNMMLMITNFSPEQEAEALDVLVSRQVDGIMMYPLVRANFSKIRAMHDQRFPIVLLAGGEYDSPSDAVYMNRQAGAYKAVSHFIQDGHRRIGFIRGAMNDEEKQNGYTSALQDNGIDFDPGLVSIIQGDGYKAGYASVQSLYEKGKATAVLCSKDHIALGAMRWCREQGIRVPEDIAFIGFDDIAASSFADVPLTSVQYDVKSVTKKATELLLKRIEEKEHKVGAPLQKIAIDPKLIIRQS